MKGMQIMKKTMMKILSVMLAVLLLAPAYAALVKACERLQEIIAACRAIPNKELARFTGQINSLAEKWQKWAKK